MTRMARKFLLVLFVYSLWAIVYSLTPAEADIVIKIRAINPLETEAPVLIHYPLPKEVAPKDIVAKRIKFSGRPAAQSGQKSEEEPVGNQDVPEASAVIPADFEVEYDKKNKYYYVAHELTLAPKQIVTLEVGVRDVWAIPPEQTDRIKAQVQELLEKYPQMDETAIRLKDEILRQLDEIRAIQDNSTAGRVGVEKHIQSHGKNAEALRQAQMDVKMLQNLLKQAQKAKKLKK